MSAATDDDRRDDWNSHWSKYSEAAAANPAQQYRRRLITKRLRATPHPRVLDVGSGQGDISVGLAEDRPDAEIAGVELSAVGVAIAGRRLPTARFFEVDLLQAADPPDGLRQWADVAVCSEVLEHLDEPRILLQNLQPYLSPEADLIVTVPAGPRNAYEQYIGHRRHYSVRALRQLLEDAGYEVLDVTAAGFPFFNLYKLMGLLRGRKLVVDADAESTEQPLVLRLALAAFRLLFQLNLDRGRWGWQLVAVARARAGAP